MNSIYKVYHADRRRLDVTGKPIDGTLDEGRKPTLVHVKNYKQWGWVTRWAKRHPDAEVWVESRLQQGKQKLESNWIKVTVSTLLGDILTNWFDDSFVHQAMCVLGDD